MLKNFLAFTCLTLSISAQSAAIQWNLTDVSFDDGGTATGSFFYDADTNTYSNISITTAGGTAAPGSLYAFQNPDINSTARNLFLTASASPVRETWAFNVNLIANLTSAGGTVDLATLGRPIAFESKCSPVDNCEFFNGIPRQAVTGSVSAIPLPAAAWLLGSALLGLGVAKRRKA